MLTKDKIYAIGIHIFFVTRMLLEFCDMVHFLLVLMFIGLQIQQNHRPTGLFDSLISLLDCRILCV